MEYIPFEEENSKEYDGMLGKLSVVFTLGIIVALAFS